MEKKPEQEAINQKVTELIEALIAAGFTENIEPAGVSNGKVFVKLVAQVDSATFNKKIQLLSPKIRVYAAWTGSSYDTTDQVRAIEYRYANNPQFALAL